MPKETKKFQKKKENFVCEHCGVENFGNGYTNHCKECLWSKHVDINPGDRLSECGGLMKPTEVQTKGDTYILTHKCQKCAFTRRNYFGENDNFDTLITFSQKSAQDNE